MIVSGLCALATLRSIQTGCAFALLVLTVGLYARNRTAGLVVVWATWLLAPLLRRVLFLSDPVEKADPLALAPFIVTAAVVALELTTVRLSRRSRRMLLLVVGGYALGLPSGLFWAPPSAVFALFAYLTAVGCFVIGYREAGRGHALTLPAVLMIGTPLLALYAFRQYYLPLPEWDHIWRETAEINTVGAPEEGKIRVWSTLNSPGTFAAVLGVGLLMFIATGRAELARILGAAVVFGALALTFVRSAWVGVAVGVIAIAVVTRGRALVRIAAVGAVIAALGALTLGGSTATALTDRINTFGSLEEDTSGQTRLGTSTFAVPLTVQAPLGFGLGRAGEPARLVEGGITFRHTDNGYLSLLFQLGPVGCLLVLTALGRALVGAWRTAWRRPQVLDVLTVAVLTFFTVTMLAGDQLFGVTGMIFWYTAGFATRRRELQARNAE